MKHVDLDLPRLFYCIHNSEQVDLDPSDKKIVETIAKNIIDDALAIIPAPLRAIAGWIIDRAVDAFSDAISKWLAKLLYCIDEAIIVKNNKKH